MSQSEQRSSSFVEAEQFLSHSYASEDQFVEELTKFCQDSQNREQLYLYVLIELKNSVISGKIDTFKKCVKVINFVSETENPETLKTLYNDEQNPIKTTNLVILSCKYDSLEMLKYVFDDGKVLENLSVKVDKAASTPADQDESRHDAFYYAVLSCNVELLHTLIKNWPRNYFSTRSEELDEILSKVYEELKLKNMSLSESMEMFVESQLNNLRFYSNATKKDRISDRDKIRSIKHRVDLVLENITLLRSKYSDVEKLDDRFLFVAKFIAQNIHVLKRQLKVTYDKLPWEEMEFCLVSFISSYVNRLEINFFYRAVLDKSKILHYLGNFAAKLEAEKSNIEYERSIDLAHLPKLTRDEIIAGIIRNNPEFRDLYNDHQRIRDIHSLVKMHVYLNFALSVEDAEGKQNQSTIFRALQVVGECLKNTPESPNLSHTTSELLIVSLPKNTRKIVVDFRNSLSKAYSLFRKNEILENVKVNFFTGAQNDMKTINNKISEILCDEKTKIIRQLLQKIVNSTSIHEFVDIAETLMIVEVGMNSLEFNVFQKLEMLVKAIDHAITEQTYHEKDILNEMKAIIKPPETQSEDAASDCDSKCVMLNGVLNLLRINANLDADDNNISVQKCMIATALQSIFPPEISPDILKQIVELSTFIFYTARSRLHGDHLNKLIRLQLEIVRIAESRISDVAWIRELREKLQENGIFTPTSGNQSFTMSENDYKKQLTQKLPELKTVLEKNPVNPESSIRPFYREVKRFHAAVETLVLDILSILGEIAGRLEDTLLFFDENSPLLRGKYLRDYLAHGNILLDVLSTDLSRVIILNAEKLVSEQIAKGNKKIGKFAKDDPTKLREKFDRSIIIITKQEEMFDALEQGNLEELNNCMAEGADIRAKNIDLSSAFHFASRGPNVEVVEFILAQKLDVHAKDSNGQNALHVAASYGRKKIVELLLTEAELPDTSSDKRKRTPLHLAAINNHVEIVDMLLHAGDTCFTSDVFGYAPIQYAAQYNNVEIVETLLKKVNVNYESVIGSTPLHIAADYGRLEVVNFLLDHNARIGAKLDNGTTPLQLAVLYGHFEVVKTLILNGADVNAQDSSGVTSLLSAVERDREEIAKFLLQHGADPNTAIESNGYAPLHFATRNAHENIVDALLSHHADVELITKKTKISPLHFAVQKSSSKIVNSLLDLGADIRAKDSGFFTPLHYAADSGQTEIAKILIERGAEVDSRSNDTSPPLFIAALRGHERIVALLIENNAAVDIKDSEGNSPLFGAAENGHFGICQLLVAQNESIVNSRKTNNKLTTPLHSAAFNGYLDIAAFLIENGAHVNTEDNYTPLHAAIERNNKAIVELLIQKGAKVNMENHPDHPDESDKSSSSSLVASPLFFAVNSGFEEIVKILVASKADVNDTTRNKSPLLSAIEHGHREIVQILISNGADINVDQGEPLKTAVLKNQSEILKILLQNKADINSDSTYDDVDNSSLLHQAAELGHKDVVSVLISNGFAVNAVTNHGETPLHIASKNGYEEIAEILIKHKANINYANHYGTPLHAAVANNHANIVKLLMRHKPKIVKNSTNRFPLELAVQHGHVLVVQLLLKNKEIKINTKCETDSTLLHVAAREPSLKMVEFLVDEGCSIHARNNFDSKPIHVAARENQTDNVEFFFKKSSSSNSKNKLSIEEIGGNKQTLLHYAVFKDSLEVVNYLLEKGANVHAKDVDDATPLHFAAAYGHVDCAEVLLKNGAFYDLPNNIGATPLAMARGEGCCYLGDPGSGIHVQAKKDKNVINLLASTDNLFRAVKSQNDSQVKNFIKLGAFINAKRAPKGMTALHYSARAGSVQIINILLEHEADPNALCTDNDDTPLHLAAKKSNFECAKALLCHGAIYNPVATNGKTPLEYSSNVNIIELLKLTDECFKLVEKRDVQIIDTLEKIETPGILKAVMNACNKDKKTLIAVAYQNNAEFVDRLMSITDKDKTEFHQACEFLDKDDYKSALDIFERLLTQRKESLGPNNLATVAIQKCEAELWYKRDDLEKAINMLQDVYIIQKELLGSQDKRVLETKSLVAFVLHLQGHNNEALEIYQEVYSVQEKTFGETHPETLDTQINMGNVLQSLGKYEQALRIYTKVFEERKKTLEVDDMPALKAQNNIAGVLGTLGEYEESMKIFKQVFEKRKSILGDKHHDTRNTKNNIATIFLKQGNIPEALEVYQDVLNMMENSLPSDDPEITKTRRILADLFYTQRDFLTALKFFKQCYGPMEKDLGNDHPSVTNVEKKMQFIELKFASEDETVSQIIESLQSSSINP